jgi:glutamate synthase domain-containing protein 1/glutamate synthase domain-containing protein 3
MEKSSMGRKGLKVDRLTTAERLLSSRRKLLVDTPPLARTAEAAEGGCGVLGLACNIPLAGRHVIPASRQMHNRGNGKGGGIAAAGLDAAQMDVTPEMLRSHYLLQVAYLDPSARRAVEARSITPYFDVAQGYAVPTLEDHRAVEGLELRPPDVWRYFVRVKPAVLDRFASENDLTELPARAIEDEFVYQNSFRLNQLFYASLGGAQGQRAFVLSHGRDLLVLKIVGYAEQAAAYYRLEDLTAHVWIAHQRYPTKGRVWHPGGAHPFVGLNEALVHNGDFANYHAVAEYLRQRNIAPLFLTDTEVSVLLFDLWDRVYGYPLEVTLEALAPTTERDLDMLTPEKQRLYRAIQATHIHASPDGPWFFIIARSQPDAGRWQLLGITDTSMLRPQVFALYDGRRTKEEGRRVNGEAGVDTGLAEEEMVQLGLVASERQAIQAALRSLAAEDRRFLPHADKYWVARGGSHTDGGAFVFSVAAGKDDPTRHYLTCADKFGMPVTIAADQQHLDRARLDARRAERDFRRMVQDQIYQAFDDGGAPTLYRRAGGAVREWDYDQAAAFVEATVDFGRAGADEWAFSHQALTLMRDRRYDTGAKRRASLLTLLDESLVSLFESVPLPPEAPHGRITWHTRDRLCPPSSEAATLLVDALDFSPEGETSAARLLVNAHRLGWRRFIVYNWRGGRFAACGLGPDTADVRVDIYGDAGDYLGSGLDGAKVHVHGDAQDQVGQILKSGTLVIHGDVGQTFLYGAKGGQIYILGSAAGRPLINAVGQPRAVINGTCLDYLAESFMAGDPLNGGGFVILNGISFDEHGRIVELETPYPGSNLFSLASGGAIYLRDPRDKVEAGQLNGGRFAPLSEADWALIEPYLVRNEQLFGVAVDALLTVNGHRRPPQEVYRKVEVKKS